MAIGRQSAPQPLTACNKARKRIKLGIIDFAQPARLHVDCDSQDCSAVLV